jgi:hypothetical protein
VPGLFARVERWAARWMDGWVDGGRGTYVQCSDKSVVHAYG